MEGSIRKPFQGVWNIIRFNWHFYAWSAFIVAAIFAIQRYTNLFGITGDIIAWLIICSTFISLAVSCYVYDFSSLYKFNWLPQSGMKQQIINIHAGFDETSYLIKDTYKNAELSVADFYNPARHTEISIKRARKTYPPFPGTRQVSATHLSFAADCADKIFAVLSAHEIREDGERILFFKELHRMLKPHGQIIVIEHLRDTTNFLAYNIGFFHFHSRATWLYTFRSAGLTVVKEKKITPFITAFILEKHGTAS